MEEELNKLKAKGHLKKGEKMKEKLQAADLKAVQARNEYALNLSAANGLKKRYYNVRMQCMAAGALLFFPLADGAEQPD